MSLVIGQVLQNRYRIVQLLGQGGMGAVYLAEDTRLGGRRCAVKENVPHPSASANALVQLRAQFQQEAQVLASLDHPNLPKVYDCFSDLGNEYMVMEYVEGEDLAGTLGRHSGPLPEKPVLIWMDQVLNSLEYLHGQCPYPILHRDIKPANIILLPNGRIKLVDFGLVKLFDPQNPQTVTIMKGMGTPEYAPLEQYASGIGHTGPYTDLYSLGAVMYHLLTHTIPPDVHQRLLDPTKLPAPRTLNPALSPGTNALVVKAMEIYPKDRFQSAADMRAALAAARQALAPTVVMLPPSVPTVVAPYGQAPAASSIACPQCGQANAHDEVYCQYCASLLGAGEMACPHCHTQIPAGSSFCPACGLTTRPSGVKCSGCNYVNGPGEIYCQKCGRPLAGFQRLPCGHRSPLNARFCPECGYKA